jgi:adenylate cyclase
MNDDATSERRLAAIMVGDVVGYSRLMGTDEEGTLAELKIRRLELIDPLIGQHKGRIVKTTGDGILIEFASVVDAVRCGVAIQQGMFERNAGIEESRQILLRIGINIGDIIFDDGDIFGDGVNVAARLESLAEPGEICVSASVREHVGEKLPVNFVDRGQHEVKNIDRPIHVYRIDPQSRQETPTRNGDTVSAPRRPEHPSIAVLPFDNMSGDPEQDYFADGMVEDIITGLSRINWLFVIARNSSFVYKGQAVDLKQVGRDLGVRYILEGSVRKAANRVRVTGQLIDAETGQHVWADRYDREIDDIFAIQDELTINVVGAIEPSLRQAEIDRIKRKRPENFQAYDLLLQALPHVYLAMPGDASEALPILEKALDLEPNYALAHGFAAWAHEIIYARGGGHNVNRDEAIRHAQAAIGHGREDALALTLGGFVMGLVAHDRDIARQAIETAMALSPSCALAYNLGSVVMVFGGDAERAIEWSEQALRLSPVDPMNFAPWLSLCLGHFQQGDYETASEAAHKTFQANPNWSSAHFVMAATDAKLGRMDEARQAGRRVLELQPDFTVTALLNSFAIQPALAEPLRDALLAAGLPEE